MKAQSKLEYVIQSGAKSAAGHRAMTIASIITTTACIIMISILFILSLNIKENMKEFQVENAMLAFVQDTMSEANARKLEPEIAKIDHVIKVTFITKKEAYEKYIEQYGDTAGGSESHLEASVFRDRYAIEIDDQAYLKAVEQRVKAIKGIADTRVDEVISKGFAAVQKTIKLLGIFIAVMLLSISVIIMTNTIKLTTIARQEEISVMKMMGAYDSFVRMPFIVEGCIVGLAGALFAFSMTSGMYGMLCSIMKGEGILSLIRVIPYTQLAGKLFAVEVAMGLGVGIMGSMIVIRKHLQV